MNPFDTDDSNLIKLCIRSYQDDYKEISENWRHLDSKAQGSIAICGILSAATAAFVSRKTVDLNCFEQILVTLTLISLAVGILFALLSMQLRAVVEAPYAGTIQSHIKSILKFPNERSNPVTNLWLNQIDDWEACNSSAKSSLDSKSKHLQVSHWAILIATFLISVTGIFKIFFP